MSIETRERALHEDGERTTRARRGRERGDLNARVLAGLARWVIDVHGEATLARIATDAGLDPADLSGVSRWVTAEEFSAVLTGARALVADDDAFQRACVYRLRDGLGPFRFLLWATSPRALYRFALRHIGLVIDPSYAHHEILDFGATHMHYRYVPSRPEPRVMCLSRQASNAALPTTWGLPAAHITETTCAARGDRACEYLMRWQERRRWTTVALGGAVGAAVGAVAVLEGGESLGLAAAVSALGLLGGYTYESVRTHRSVVGLGDEIRRALGRMAEQDGEARRELLALREREQDWSRRLEAELDERLRSLRAVGERITELRDRREIALRGYTHDLRNPLAALRAESATLASRLDRANPDNALLVEDHDHAVARLETLLDEMMSIATAEAHVVPLEPSAVRVAPLVDELRRRLGGLAHRKDLRITVFRAREAPDDLTIDPVVLDRIIDNVLTNAVKYTDRGSIVVEVGGAPGALVLKVSDTGRGIEPARIERIFKPGGTASADRGLGSYGFGLSIVVDLLELVGGRLEIMSAPNQGTTFWIYLPISPPRAGEAGSLPPPASTEGVVTAAAPEDARLARVVRIRRGG